MANKSHTTPEERAAKRVKDFNDLAWHAASYVIVNAFLWIIVPEAALWVTLGWGIGLAFHIANYFIADTSHRSRRYQAYLAEERAREDEGSA